MERHTFVFILTAILMMSSLMTIFPGTGSGSGYSTLKVGEDGDYGRINEALQNASQGDHIVISDGVFMENLIITTSVKLIGAGPQKTAIMAADEGDMVVVKADNCTISGIAFLGGDGTDAALLVKSDFNTIESCYFQGASSALKIEGSSGNLIQNNTFSYNGDPGEIQDHQQLESGLIAHWAMDERNWTGQLNEVRDSSGNGLHGTSMKGSDTVKDGRVGSAGHFDGTDDFIEMDDYSDLDFGTSSFSASVWINLDPDGPTSIGNKIIQKRGGRDKSWGQLPGWMMAVQRHGTNVYVKNTGVDDGKGNSIELANMGYVGKVEKWIHLVFTWDGLTARLYVDGGDIIFNRSNPNMGSIDNSRKASIGCHWNDANFQDQFFHGLIDDVRVYNRTLDLEDVTLLYGELSLGTIVFDGSDDNLVIDNRLANNAGIGVAFRSSSDNVATNNTLQNNKGYSFYVDTGSSGNLVYLNEISMNNMDKVQAFDSGINNRWDLYGEGNYWSDWTTPDTDGDLVVDQSYYLDGAANSSDRYPLIHGTEKNTAPRIITSNKVIAYVDENYNVTYNATDMESLEQDLDWTIKTNASWLGVNERMISGIPSITDMGSYWIDVMVSDDELFDRVNFTIRVLQRSTPPPDKNHTDNDTEYDGEFKIDDLFPLDDDEADYTVEENDNVDVEVKEDGSVEVDPKGEWEGSEEITIERIENERTEIQTFRLLFVDGKDDAFRTIIEFELDEEQVLYAVADPELELRSPLTIRWDLENFGQIGVGEILRPNLLPGYYILTIHITDDDGRMVKETYDIRVGIEPIGEDDDVLTLEIFGMMILLGSVSLFLLLLLVGFALRRRKTAERTLKKSEIGNGYSSLEAIYKRERKGPSLDISGDGSIKSDSYDNASQIKVGSLDIDPITIQGRSGSSSLSVPSPDHRIGEIRKLALDWEGGDEMGSTDIEILGSLKRRYQDGEISKSTYDRICRGLGPE
jgi:parallel beta-helix repeat protein